MTRWFAFQVDAGGTRCVGEVWALDAADAFLRATVELRCRVDYVSHCS